MNAQTMRLLALRVAREQDIVSARQRTRQIAALLHFDMVGQTRLATAVSELARNALQYAGGGTVEFRLAGTMAPQVFLVTVSDQGPGIPHLNDVLAGRYQSPTGMGLGLVGTRRLMDQFDIVSGPRGTTVTLKKLLPPRAPLVTAAGIAAISDRVAQQPPRDALEEVQLQNQELLQALDALRARQEELERVNRELEDTNRGVVALYAELDERADHLRRADELKTRFLSNMTHEFRTPVNAILALTTLLAERLETPPDQKDEVYYIRKSGQQLADIVDDLLDLAKVEAGKIQVRPAPFEVPALFGALRGMLRPLLLNQALNLVFEEPEDLPPILSDESKVSQVLRNFISNALKYTERGEVRVTAALAEGRDAVTFSVSDTGIGIPEPDLPRIFEEFVQIENPLQRRVKGTGLGLPLSRRLAELLGGTVSVRSTLGEGSVFTLTIPLIYGRGSETVTVDVEPDRMPVLIIEDRPEDLLLVERHLSRTRYQPIGVRSIAALQSTLDSVRPSAIILDIRLHGQDSWDLLAGLKRQPQTAAVPVLVVSTLDDPQKAFALGADACHGKPVAREWLIETLDRVTAQRPPLRVLVIDDEETSRFIIKSFLTGFEYTIVEARTGVEGVALAQALTPDVILLDYRLTDVSGAEVRNQLAEAPATAGIPVIVVTSQTLTPVDVERIGAVQGVLSKSSLTRASLRQALDACVKPRPTLASEADRG